MLTAMLMSNVGSRRMRRNGCCSGCLVKGVSGQGQGETGHVSPVLWAAIDGECEDDAAPRLERLALELLKHSLQGRHPAPLPSPSLPPLPSLGFDSSSVSCDHDLHPDFPLSFLGHPSSCEALSATTLSVTHLPPSHPLHPSLSQALPIS